MQLASLSSIEVVRLMFFETLWVQLSTCHMEDLARVVGPCTLLWSKKLCRPKRIPGSTSIIDIDCH